MERAEPDRARAVRTLLGDIAGPVVPGDAEVRVVVVRRGSNQTNVRAELAQGGKIVALASAVLSAPRPSLLGTRRPRIAPPPAHASVARLPAGAPGSPVFTRHFDYRPLPGAAPFFGAKEAATSGWIREARAPSRVDAPMLVALLDAWWPASLVTITTARPAATVAFAAHILVDPASLDPEVPLFHDATTVTEHEGFELEMRALYDARGECVGMNQQTFAVIA